MRSTRRKTACTKCGTTIKWNSAREEWLDYFHRDSWCRFYGAHEPDPIIDNGWFRRFVLRQPKYINRD